MNKFKTYPAFCQNQDKNWTNRNISCINDSYLETIIGRYIMSLNPSFDKSARARAVSVAMLGAVALASFTSAATPVLAQDRVKVFNASTTTTSATSPTFDKKAMHAAWKASIEDGGTLVVWYDQQYEEAAMLLVDVLKERGHRNVVAKPGRLDGHFQLFGASHHDKDRLWTVEQAEDGTLLNYAETYAKIRKIAYMDFDDGAPDVVDHLDKRLA